VKGKKEKKYESTRTNRFYPGRISEERVQQLTYFKVHPDEITTDDIAWSLSRSRTLLMYALLGYIQQKWGENEALEAARTIGYLMGNGMMTRRLQGLGTDRQTAEQMASYQDVNHALGGVYSSTNYSEWDDENVMVYRTTCAFHTPRPEGMKSYCRPIIDGYITAYQELDKNIAGMRDEKCLCMGDDHCYGGFKYKK
jgi:hypothetical protein